MKQGMNPRALDLILAAGAAVALVFCLLSMDNDVKALVLLNIAVTCLAAIFVRHPRGL